MWRTAVAPTAAGESLVQIMAKLTADQRTSLQLLLDADIVSEAEVIKTGGNTKALRVLIDGAWRRRQLEDAIILARDNGMLKPEEVERARKQPGFLRDVMYLRANGQLLGLSDAQVRKAQDAYVAKGGTAGRIAAERAILTDGLKSGFGITLPPGAFDAFRDPRTILNVVADLQLAGVGGENVVAAMSGAAFFDNVKKGGLQQALLKVVHDDNAKSPLFEGEGAEWKLDGAKFIRLPRPGGGQQSTPSTSSKGSANTGRRASTPGSRTSGGGSSQSSSSGKSGASRTYNPDVWSQSAGTVAGKSGGASNSGGSSNSNAAGSGTSASGGSGTGSANTGTGGSGATNTSASSGTSGGGGTASGPTTGSGESGSGSASGDGTGASGGGGSTKAPAHGGRTVVGEDDVTPNGDGTTTVVTYFSDGSWSAGVFDAKGNRVGGSQSAANISIGDGKDMAVTFIPSTGGEDTSSPDAEMSGDPSDPNSFTNPKIAGIISEALSGLLAMQLHVRMIKRGGAIDPGRDGDGARTRDARVIVPDRLRSLLVGDDRRGGDGHVYDRIIDPSAVRMKNPGNSTPDPNRP